MPRHLAAAITLAAVALTTLPPPAQALEQQKERTQLLDRHPIDKNMDEAISLTVELQPGQQAAPHRHDAQVFVYMLEGEVQMQLKGQEPRTLHQGDTYYESPSDIHTVTRNTGTTPARFVVFMLKKHGVAPALPVAK